MDTNDNPQSLIDAVAVARWLNVTVSTVYEKAANGVIPHVRLWKGTRRTMIRFRREDIEQYVQDRSISAGTCGG